MNNSITGWAMNAIGIYLFVAGSAEMGLTACCTAIVLFSLKENK